MLLILTSLVFIIIAVYFVFYSFFVKLGRFRAFKAFLLNFLPSLLNSKVAKFLLIAAFILIAYSNVLGNVPGNYTPTQYYSVVMTLSFTF